MFNKQDLASLVDLQFQNSSTEVVEIRINTIFSWAETEEEIWSKFNDLLKEAFDKMEWPLSKFNPEQITSEFREMLRYNHVLVDKLYSTNISVHFRVVNTKDRTDSMSYSTELEREMTTFFARPVWSVDASYQLSPKLRAQKHSSSREERKLRINPLEKVHSFSEQGVHVTIKQALDYPFNTEVSFKTDGIPGDIKYKKVADVLGSFVNQSWTEPPHVESLSKEIITLIREVPGFNK